MRPFSWGYFVQKVLCGPGAQPRGTLGTCKYFSTLQGVSQASKVFKMHSPFSVPSRPLLYLRGALLTSMKKCTNGSMKTNQPIIINTRPDIMGGKKVKEVKTVCSTLSCTVRQKNFRTLSIVHLRAINPMRFCGRQFEIHCKKGWKKGHSPKKKLALVHASFALSQQ